MLRKLTLNSTQETRPQDCYVVDFAPNRLLVDTTAQLDLDAFVLVEQTNNATVKKRVQARTALQASSQRNV
jgi:hypothetical protein